MLGIWLPVIMYRKSHIVVQMVLFYFTLDDLENSNQGHSTFKRSVSQKQYMLDIWLLLIMYRKSHIVVQMVLSDFTLDELERSNQGHSTFKRPVPH